MKKTTAAALAAAAALAIAVPVRAITWGWRDGNAHPQVGAMMAYWDASNPGQLSELCTGTLVAPRVFLTAAHCTDYLLNDLDLTDVWVSFDQNSAEGPYYHGVMHQDPAYPGPASDPHDIAVIVLDKAVKGVTPATLPAIGTLDRMKKAGTLNQSTAFTAVGYGDRERVKGGSQGFLYDGWRWTATSYYNSLQSSWLRLTQNASVGAGGTCFGDSGGPNFFAGTTVIAATTITGDSQCVSTNVDYRMDTAEAQAFLAQFGVPLP
jgi:secreted trypsin-like serine protease